MTWEELKRQVEDTFGDDKIDVVEAWVKEDGETLKLYRSINTNDITQIVGYLPYNVTPYTWSYRRDEENFEITVSVYFQYKIERQGMKKKEEVKEVNELEELKLRIHGFAYQFTQENPDLRKIAIAYQKAFEDILGDDNALVARVTNGIHNCHIVHQECDRCMYKQYDCLCKNRLINDMACVIAKGLEIPGIEEEV